MQAIIINHMKKAIAYSATVPARAGQPRVQLARVLFPGSNTVDAKEFEEATKKSPVWDKWLQDGKSNGVTVQKAEGGLIGLDPDEAVEVVGETLNQKLLDDWSAEETRPKVKKAIAKQQKVLEKKMPKGEEDAA